MTRLALRCTRYVNGVALRHQQVSQAMFPDAAINVVTNGVHAATWTAPAFRALFDRRIPAWRRDNQYLRSVVDIPLDEIEAAHAEAKQALLAEVTRRTSVALDPAAFTLAFARRATAYKRADLIFRDVERLRAIAQRHGPIQLVFGGKAHPRDDGGKRMVQHLFSFKWSPGIGGRVVYLDDYDLSSAARMVRGCDVWLNLPRPPLEASGTSGMKSAVNGGLQLSVLDGWWAEGYDGENGWALPGDEDPDHGAQDQRDGAELHRLLDEEVSREFYDRDAAGLPRAWLARMRASLKTNGPAFSASRMVREYVERMYAEA
jgi:starch phosphorylase